MTPGEQANNFALLYEIRCIALYNTPDFYFHIRIK
ncbi:hypothetical protein SAMN05421578_112125 [Paenibacillus macquariensis]|uniref:Uncharacterized protein n=1 Tax=Paenibacillus macquariensis TaxID=948756 RepID=A0ABY1K7W3_9BACL|nr:hypothetical protein SAMN05421578_112125 [Paenibacillus macquariensis]